MIIYRTKRCSIFLVILSNCVPCSEECIDYCSRGYQSMADYPINSIKTDTGIGFDSSDQDIPFELIDQLFNEVEDCLIKEFPFGIIPEDIILSAGCMNKSFNPIIKRQCLTVKIPNDWILSIDGKQQTLNILAPSELCKQKGLYPTKKSPCRWRAGIQNNTTILVTPNLLLLKDPIIRIVTGCNNPWGNLQIAKCAKNTSFISL